MAETAAQPRILITRLSHIGDCVLTMPLLCALRQAFPSAFLAWAVESPSHQVLQGHVALDEIIKIPKGWLERPRTLLQVRRELRQRQFDLVLDPQGLTKSAMLGWVSGARRRIGLARPAGRELAPWLASERVSAENQHIVPRTLELLRVLGIRRPAVEFQVPIATEAFESMRSFVSRAPLSQRFCIVNPGASWASKRWEISRFAQVAHYLHRHRGMRSVVVWAGDQERRWAEEVVSHSEGSAILAPSTSLQELAALATLGSLFVSSDSGPLHLAAAVGSPVVGLYGVTHPNACGAYGPAARNVQAYYHAGTARQRRTADNRAMLAISVEMVTEACESLLEQSWKDRHRAA